jgi:hypothetical protein
MYIHGLGGRMEKLVLISQAVSRGVIFYVVIYFLITWHWPETLLSVFMSTYFLLFVFQRVGEVPFLPRPVVASCRPASRSRLRFTRSGNAAATSLPCRHREVQGVGSHPVD